MLSLISSLLRKIDKLKMIMRDDELFIAAIEADKSQKLSIKELRMLIDEYNARNYRGE